MLSIWRENLIWGLATEARRTGPEPRKEGRPLTMVMADADADEDDGTPEIIRICSSARSIRRSLIVNNVLMVMVKKDGLMVMIMMQKRKRRRETVIFKVTKTPMSYKCRLT